MPRDWKVWTDMWTPETIATTNSSNGSLVFLFFLIVYLLFIFIFMVETLDMRYTLLLTLQNTFASCILSAGLASFINILNTRIYTYTHVSCFYTHIQMYRSSLNTHTLKCAITLSLSPTHKHIHTYLPTCLTSSLLRV